MDPSDSGVRTGGLAFVLEKVAHASPPSQDKLRDVLDNLGLVLGGQSGEPFGQALDKRGERSAR